MATSFQPLWATAPNVLQGAINQSKRAQRRNQLFSQQFAALETELQTLQQQFDQHMISEEDYEDAFFKGLIGIGDLRQEASHLAWIAAYPQSYVAQLIYGRYCYEMLYVYRGCDTSNTLTPFRLLKMWEWGWKCFTALQKATQLPVGKPMLACKQMISLLRVWDGEISCDLDDPWPPLSADELALAATPRQPLTPELLNPRYWLDKGLYAQPDSMSLRSDYLYLLTPQWGGSEEAMCALVEESLPHLGIDQKRLLEADCYRQRAFYHERFTEDEQLAQEFYAEAQRLESLVSHLQTEEDRTGAVFQNASDLYDAAESAEEYQQILVLMDQTLTDAQAAEQELDTWLHLKAKIMLQLDRYTEAETYYLATIQLGNSDALRDLNLLYTQDWSALMDAQRLQPWLKELLAMDLSEGYNELSRSLYFGCNGYPVDIAAAEQPAIEAAKRGNSFMITNVAQHYFLTPELCDPVLGNDPDLGLRWLYWAANSMRNSRAQRILGTNLLNSRDFGLGDRFPYDPENGIAWLQEAAENDEADAYYWLAWAWRDGHMPNATWEQAVAFYDACIQQEGGKHIDSAIGACQILLEQKAYAQMQSFIDYLQGQEHPSGWFYAAEQLWQSAPASADHPQRQEAIRLMQKAQQMGDEDAETSLAQYQAYQPQGLLGRLGSFLKK